MNTILGLGHLLGRSELDEAQRRQVGQIVASGRFLLGLLDDILTFSKAEAGQIALERTEFDLGRIMADLSTIMSVNVGNKPIEVLIGVAPDVPQALIGDPLRLQQVLINLTGNAIKFTERGEVALLVAPIESDGGRIVLRFSVRDTGIGIDKDRIDELFTPFTQGDASTTRRFGGTGLGLAICQRLVTLMGGEIGVDSTSGKGSEFWFTVPFERAEDEAAQGKRTSDGQRSLEVLVVDDNDMARDVLSSTVRALGWHGETEESGSAAIDNLRRRKAAGDGVDLLLIDWQMPGMDGLMTARVVRSEHLADRGPIIIMATAHDRDELRTQPDTDKVDAVLTKPVTASTLFDTVAEIEAGRSGGRLPLPVKADNETPSINGLRVLLVEDNDINRDVTRRVLEMEGVDVATAHDGREAVDRIAAEPHRFDLVLMDVQMPVMDGFETTRTIRKTLDRPDLPIIALTAGAFEADRERCREAGMDDFIPKPFDPDQMIHAIARHCGGKDRAPAPRSTPEETDDFGPAIPGIDMRQAAIRLGGDRKMFASLLKRVAEQFEDTPRQTRADLDQGRKDEAARRLHALRGAVGNVAAVEVAALATELEAAVKDGTTDRIPTLLDRLEKAMDDLAAAIRARPFDDYSSGDAAAEPASDDEVAALLALLEQRNVKAIEAFETMRPALVARLGTETAARLGKAMEDLRFEDAAAILNEGQSKG